MPLKTLYLIRHGELPEEVRRLYVGQVPTPLSEAGRASCRALSPFLLRRNPERLFASPLPRTVESAKLIFPDRDPEFDKRLMEMDFGELTLHNFEWIQEHYPETAADMLKLSSFDQVRFPGGESVKDVIARVSGFLIMLRNIPEETAAVVTHGGVLVQILRQLLAIEKGHEWDFQPERGSLTILQFRDPMQKAALKLFNYRPRDFQL